MAKTIMSELPDALVRLMQGSNEGAYLDAHHAEAGRRVLMLFERARLRQRVTMSYDPTRVGGGRPMQADIADSAADARGRLNQLAGLMAPDCWNVIADICGFDKGLQEVESTRNWPRRSAKLVLRIGLEQLAMHWGLSAAGVGRDSGRSRNWLEERVPMFGD